MLILCSVEQDDTTLLFQLLGDRTSSEEGNWPTNSAINMSTMNNKGISFYQIQF